MVKKVKELFQNLTSLPGYFSDSWLLYLLLGSFIMGWWIFALCPTAPLPVPLSSDLSPSQFSILQSSTVLQNLSPLPRDALQRALAGHFPSMLAFIDQWDQDAEILIQQGVPGIQRLPYDTYFQAHLLGSLMQNCSGKFLRNLNACMHQAWIKDNSGRIFHNKNNFCRFLPQTHMAASFLLAIAPSHEIIALPKGLRQFQQLYSAEQLASIPEDIDLMDNEKLFLQNPDLAFIASYSHPLALEVLHNHKIHLCSIDSIHQVTEIRDALLKIGHSSNHLLEAQLLAIFMDACFLSIDNRLQALQTCLAKSFRSPLRLLYLSHWQYGSLPTTKSLAGQLLVRALRYCPHLLSFVPESQSEWRIPFEQEKIIQFDPDILILSTPVSISPLMSIAVEQTKAFQSQHIFYVDEIVQNSPTQYVVLAYFDLFQALEMTYGL